MVLFISVSLCLCGKITLKGGDPMAEKPIRLTSLSRSSG
jgi:hypothetical protein